MYYFQINISEIFRKRRNDVLNKIKNNKIPDPDVFTTEFYQILFNWN